MMGYERFQAALHGTKLDRIPMIVGNYNTFSCQFYGVTVNQLLENSELLADL